MFKPKVFITILGITVILSLLLAGGCGAGKSSSGLEKITVTLDWTPNTNHTGLFVAKDKGFYRAEGLEVEIVQMSGGSVEQLVASGKSQFGVSYQEAVTFARTSNIPIISIAAVLQHNTSGFASLKAKGIETPRDFEGKRYGGWGSPIEEATIKALMDKYGGDFNEVEILTTGAVDFFVISEKEADFSWIFFGWDGVAAELKGIELNYIELGKIDPALDYYTPVLITSAALIKNNPALVERFMKATMEGYRLAMEDPQEAAEILLANAPELDRELVLASQRWLKDKYQAEAEVWGWQKKEVWERYARWLYERGLLEAGFNADKAFTNEFLR